ncbi:MAG TPA: hypothetical protein VFA85_15755 [Terriglobales bacterium]|nr:hypothetical protein [Terriglobales bacterium]
MEALSSVYDAQQQLARQLERLSTGGDGDSLAGLIQVARQVVHQLDTALETAGFRRADYWSPEEPDWVSPSQRPKQFPNLAPGVKLTTP